MARRSIKAVGSIQTASSSSRRFSSLSDDLERAKERLNILTKDPGNDAKLKLYGLYKQVGADVLRMATASIGNNPALLTPTRELQLTILPGPPNILSVQTLCIWVGFLPPFFAHPNADLIIPGGTS